MDFRAAGIIHIQSVLFSVTVEVLIFLYLLIAKAAFRPVRNETLNATIQLIQEEIEIALDHLAAPGLLPNITCLSLNITELVGEEQQASAAYHLSSFRCHMLKMSALTRELSPQLQIIRQYTQDMEQLTSGRTSSRDCSLPSFEQQMDGYVYVKCLLQFLDQWLSKAEF